ncbi:hypothetical protein BpHYR1_037833 [Brachionus plicatilis]|uniref:Uncharacterized protein n=1 Tax=Brachionus plicatilis TaxID=10195 RepID=A0A3M7QY38_BRAPC|nr:hypothetical protein BpHYR1_037833 [Brachionus plicatilis]
MEKQYFIQVKSLLNKSLVFSNDPKSQKAILNHDDGLTVIVKGFGYEMGIYEGYRNLLGKILNRLSSAILSSFI